jgi:hypothetical protein
MEYQPKYFQICPTSSKIFKKLQVDDPEKAAMFAKDEDKFLKLEFDAMCQYFKNGECPDAEMRAAKMSKIHDRMVKKYGMEFPHHVIHIEMMDEKCEGEAPSKDMKGMMGCD